MALLRHARRSAAIAGLVLALLASASGPATASGKGIGAIGASEGVTVPGSPYRYSAVSPRGLDETFTVVVRTNREDGKVSRWWHLRGGYQVAAISYDGTGAGLSADGGTLVLSRFSWIYPPRSSGFAILDTRVHLRHPMMPDSPAPRHAITRVALNGPHTLHAVSPDGETVFLSEHLTPYVGGPARIRALDADSGELLPVGAVAVPEGERKLRGAPVAKSVSRDGRWAYTLYSGYELRRGRTARSTGATLSALDTARRRALQVSLDDVVPRTNPFELEMRAEDGGRDLVVYSAYPGLATARPLAVIDAETLEVSEPADEGPETGGLPWPVFAIALVALAAGIAWRAGRR